MSNRVEDNNQELRELIEDCGTDSKLDVYILDFINERDFDEYVLKEELDKLLRILKYKQLNDKEKDKFDNLKKTTDAKELLSDLISNFTFNNNIKLITATIIFKLSSLNVDVRKTVSKETWKEISFFLKRSIKGIQEDCIDPLEGSIAWASIKIDPKKHTEEEIEGIKWDKENLDKNKETLLVWKERIETYKTLNSKLSKLFKEKIREVN